MASEDFFGELAAEAKKDNAERKPPSLDEIRALAQENSEIERKIEDLESELKELKIRRYALTTSEIPVLMDELRVPYIAVDGYNYEATTHYKAAIKVDDPHKDEAFDWVEKAGGGDIINNTVTVAFPKEDAAAAQTLYDELKKRFDNQRSIQIDKERRVPWNRLTSWLKEYHQLPSSEENPKLAIPLELLNATIGRVVKVKPLREN